MLFYNNCLKIKIEMIDLLDQMKKGEVFSNLDKVFSEHNLPNLLVNYLKILNWCLHVTSFDNFSCAIEYPKI